MLDKKPYSVKLTDEEEEYLHEKGKLVSWSNTVHNWIKKDMVDNKKNNKKEKLNKLQNGLLMLFFGIFIFSFSYLIPPISADNIYMIVTLFVCSTICVMVGSISLFLEFVYARG